MPLTEWFTVQTKTLETNKEYEITYDEFQIGDHVKWNGGKEGVVVGYGVRCDKSAKDQCAKMYLLQVVDNDAPTGYGVRAIFYESLHKVDE